MPKPRIKRKKVYCPACGFPVSDEAMVLWLNEQGLKSLSKAFKKITKPK